MAKLVLSTAQRCVGGGGAVDNQICFETIRTASCKVDDASHVTPGSRGEHVRKIQIALIQLDGAAIGTDGIYGPATAAAVLAYKQKRNIINFSYQTQADNIVGKMTIASLATRN